MIITEKNNANKEWLKRINPLEGLSITQAKNIYNYSRAHGSPLLQKIYDEIELTDPVLMTCVERRQSALAGLGWRIVSDDGALADEQRDYLEMCAKAIDNLDEAIEHLDLAFFRGFSVCQPLFSGRATAFSGREGVVPRVTHINLLDSWNFLKADDGTLLWNPKATLDPADCTPITPAARCMILQRRRAIDWPALSIYIRKYLGERDWGRFIERYGIPPVDVVMAPNATDEQRDEYTKAAEEAKDGQTVAWPANSVVSRAEGSRGTDPFTAFIEHQEKLIVLMATGGTLTSLAQADTGSLAGGAQFDVWSQIVKRDGVIISQVLNRDLFAPLLRERFPGQPILARIELGPEERMSVADTADLAGKLKTAGYLVDKSELEAEIGMTLVKDETPQSWGAGASSPAPRVFNKAPANPPTSTSNLPPQTSNLLSAFAKDTGPAAEAINDLLNDPSPAKAKALLDRLPDLLPDDPAMAAVLADAMAAEFGDQIVKNRQGEKCPDCGQWLDANGVCHECHAADELEKMGCNPDDDKTQAAEIGKGNAAIAKCLDEQVDVLDAVSRSDIGTISFLFGSPVNTEEGKAYGLSHVLEKHNQKDIKRLSEALIRGKVREPGKSGNKITIDYGRYQIHLAKSFERKGKPTSDKVTFIITGFETDKEGA